MALLATQLPIINPQAANAKRVAEPGFAGYHEVNPDVENMANSPEEGTVMAAEEIPVEEDVMDAGGEPAFSEMPAPNPSLLPAVPAESVQRLGGFAGAGLARVGNYLESTSPAPSAATTEANGDDLSDLFEGPSDDDLDIQIDDLVEVTPEDVFGDGGDDLSDLVDVPSDILGMGPADDLPSAHRKRALTQRVVRNGGSPAGMGGMY